MYRTDGGGQHADAGLLGQFGRVSRVSPGLQSSGVTAVGDDAPKASRRPGHCTRVVDSCSGDIGQACGKAGPQGLSGRGGSATVVGGGRRSGSTSGRVGRVVALGKEKKKEPHRSRGVVRLDGLKTR